MRRIKNGLKELLNGLALLGIFCLFAVAVFASVALISVVIQLFVSYTSSKAIIVVGTVITCFVAPVLMGYFLYGFMKK